MAVSFQSRYAVLKIEDDDDLSDSENRLTKAAAAKKAAQTQVASSKSKKKKNNPAKETSQLQNLVISTGKQKTTKNSNANPSVKPVVPVKEQQWEEWKKKDDKFVSSSYQQDLENAILMSKLDYEEHKPIYDERQKDADMDKLTDQSKKKKKSQAKKDKPATLSLDQFQNLSSSQIEAGVTNESIVKQEVNNSEESRKLSTPSEENFFEKIGEDAEKMIIAEHKKQTYKENEPFIADHARSLELQEVLAQKEKTITELSAENEELKTNLKAAKLRNRRLCNILAQGEMRDKAEILVQIEKLNQVRDDLAKEVSELSEALEQERSKNHTLQTELKKQGGHKKESKDSKPNS